MKEATNITIFSVTARKLLVSVMIILFLLVYYQAPRKNPYIIYIITIIISFSYKIICNIIFEIYHDIYPFAFDIVLLDGAASFDEIFDGRAKVKRKNVNEILSINWEDSKSTLSPIETVDYYAELTANNINILEKAFN